MFFCFVGVLVCCGCVLCFCACCGCCVICGLFVDVTRMSCGSFLFLFNMLFCVLGLLVCLVKSCCCVVLLVCFVCWSFVY